MRAEPVLDSAAAPPGLTREALQPRARPVRLPLPSRVLVGAVGYGNLRDRSAGTAVLERLGHLGGADVEDLSYSPIDVLFLLQRRDPYRALILVGAEARGDAPGTVRVSRWARPAIDAESLQARIAEALTGVLSLDSLLHVLQHFGALPDDVAVIEIEPEDESWGEGVSAAVEASLPLAVAAVRDHVCRVLAA